MLGVLAIYVGYLFISSGHWFLGLVMMMIAPFMFPWVRNLIAFCSAFFFARRIARRF